MALSRRALDPAELASTQIALETAQAIELLSYESRRHIQIPVGVGFGIRDAATAKATAAIADAVVVGSRIVLAIEASNDDNLLDNVATLMTELKAAIDAA